jgi:putative Mg2+ transporter-C (MgtC) family protein
METFTSLSNELAAFMGAYAESMLRLLLAAALGGFIGLEREASGKPAGFRTNLLIGLGAALLTVISIEVARDVVLPGGFQADPGRIAAQIVSGIGFLGAGTILRSRGSVTGLTTAATLWVVAAIGIAAGAGAYVHAVAGTVLVMVALIGLGRWEDRLLPVRLGERVLRVTMQPRADLLHDVDDLVNDSDFKVTAVEVEKGEDMFVASFDTRGPVSGLKPLIGRLVAVEGVRKVTLH